MGLISWPISYSSHVPETGGAREGPGSPWFRQSTSIAPLVDGAVAAAAAEEVEVEEEEEEEKGGMEGF